MTPITPSTGSDTPSAEDIEVQRLYRHLPWLGYTRNPRVWRLHVIYVSFGIWFCWVATVLGAVTLFVLGAFWVKALSAGEVDFRGWVALLPPLVLVAGCVFGIRVLKRARAALIRVERRFSEE